VNGDERKDLHTVLDVLKKHRQESSELASVVNDIKVCLMGDPAKHEDLGLQGAVDRNTNFRKSSVKVLWVMVTGFVGMLYATVRNLLK
jgi:hypothetical protein